jgi:hypothetical protein
VDALLTSMPAVNHRRQRNGCVDYSHGEAAVGGKEREMDTVISLLSV